MTIINGIEEISNPLIMALPIVLITLSGLTVGKILSITFKQQLKILDQLLYGNVVVNFSFVGVFVILTEIQIGIKNFFDIFTIASALLAICAIYLITRFKLNKVQLKNLLVSNNIPIIFAIMTLAILFYFQGIVIYHHSIFIEYDAMYYFLPISKSIVFGNGLDNDFYLGSDTVMRYPVFIQSIWAWLINSFGYSSIRLFPLYFIFISALFMFRLSKNLIKDTFYSLLCSIVFLITPSILLITSRFSLQQDLAFISIITASIFSLSNLFRNSKSHGLDFFLLIILISLMPLIRELGLILSLSILFFFLATRFTKNNPFLGFGFSLLIFSPFYLLSLYDILKDGFTYIVSIRLISIASINTIICFISFKISEKQSFRHVLTYSKYFLIVIIPIIFILNNFLYFQGPYPTIIFSSYFNNALSSYRNIFDIQTIEQIGLSDAFKHLPRIEILFISVSTGSLLLLFKFIGFIKIVRNIRSIIQYSIIISVLLILISIWSYMLNSNYEESSTRHIGYFIPILSVITIIGMKRDGIEYKIYNYGVIGLALYYSLFTSLYMSNTNNIFYGFWIDPFKDPLITLNDFRLSVAILGGWLALGIIKNINIKEIYRYNIRKYSVYALMSGIFILQIYTISVVEIPKSPLQIMDREPPSGWESGLDEVIRFFNMAGEGNILSLRAPGIPFLTNRTNYDFFNPHAFAFSIFPMLDKDSKLIGEELEKRNIEYIVLPNENNEALFRYVKNLKEYEFFKDISNPNKYLKVPLAKFTIYKILDNSSRETINLLNENKQWDGLINAQVSHLENNLTVVVNTDSNLENYNRAVLREKITSSEENVLLSIVYESKSLKGKSKNYFEIRDLSGKVLYGMPLETNSNFSDTTFILPKEVLNKEIDIILYMVTESPGTQILKVNKMDISPL